MANVSKKDKNLNNEKKSNKNEKMPNESLLRNSIIMKILVFLGVIIFCFILLYLMYHFFVKESDIKINMSTDKQIEFISVNNEDTMIITQKYVSDLFYSMRYDINEFRVFKYKNQDIFKNLNDERILVAVEKSTLPSTCTKITTTNEYNNCYIESDDFTEYYYISSNSDTYKITIKKPAKEDFKEETKAKINQMLKSFSISM